jgi:ATP-binding cassette subfamily B protein
VLFGSLVPLGFLIRWFQVRSQKAFRETRHSIRAPDRAVRRETMTGIRAVKAFRRRSNGPSSRVTEWRTIVSQPAHHQALRVLDPGLVLIGNVALAVVAAGRWTAGGRWKCPAAIGVLLRRALRDRFRARAGDGSVLQLLPVGWRSRRSQECSRSRVCAGSHAPDRPLAGEGGRLGFEGVEFAYAADRVILPTFDLDIPAGQTIALVGSTGAGKSTLAKLISRFYDPSDGIVSLDGIDLRRLHPKDLAACDRDGGDAGGIPLLRLGGRQHRAGKA